MHDLIQEMGEQIVREEDIKNPGKRSRLKDSKEIYDVLKNNMGAKEVEGIIFDNTFRNMSNLKFLIFYNGYQSYIKLPSSLESFSDKLRYFRWDGYPLKSLPLIFFAETLVEFHMQRSNLIKLWDEDLVNLKSINLSGSRCLLELPDFSKARRLEVVNLSWCESLCNVHPSILSLHSLVTLNLEYCTELKSLESEVHLKSLKHLDVSRCPNLKKFYLASEKLTELHLYEPFMELVSSIGCLSKLSFLSIFDCGLIIDKGKLHILFDSLHLLEILFLYKCSYLSELPDNISALSCLRWLNLTESNIESLPASIKHLSNLERIELTNCEKLQFVPKLPPSITNLDARNCTSLETVMTPTNFGLQQDDEFCIFSFQNCRTLDGPSLIKFVQYWVKRIVNNNVVSFQFCCPRNRVPEWFGYEQMGSAITIELASPLDDLKGFILCFVLFPCFLEEDFGSYELHCRCYFGDGEEFEAFDITPYHFSRERLKLDHVFLMYEPFGYEDLLEEVKWRREIEDILEEVKRIRENDEGITYSSKFSFKFSVKSGRHSSGNLVKHDDWIKACGVWPIHASKNHNLLQQMELKMKTKRRWDIDEQQQLSPAKRFP